MGRRESHEGAVAEVPAPVWRHLRQWPGEDRIEPESGRLPETEALKAARDEANKALESVEVTLRRLERLRQQLEAASTTSERRKLSDEFADEERQHLPEAIAIMRASTVAWRGEFLAAAVAEIETEQANFLADESEFIRNRLHYAPAMDSRGLTVPHGGIRSLVQDSPAYRGFSAKKAALWEGRSSTALAEVVRHNATCLADCESRLNSALARWKGL